MVSPIGVDKEQCLDTSSTVHCKSLNYIWTYGHEIKCVMIKGLYSDQYDKSLHQMGRDTSQLKIFCDDCFIENCTLQLGCKPSKICEIDFTNVTIAESTLHLSNISLSFHDSTLINVTLTDLSDYLNENFIEIYFIKSRIMCSHEESKFKFRQQSVLKFVLSKSELLSCKMELLVAGIIFSFNGSYLVQPDIYVKVTAYGYLGIPSFVSITESIFTNPSVNVQSSQHGIILDLTNPSINIDNTTFKAVSLEIYSEDYRFDQVFFYVGIRYSSFLDIHKSGKGGALLISPLSDVLFSLAWISYCTFSANKVYKTKNRLSGVGGGFYATTAFKLHVLVDHCTFRENIAINTGMALFTDNAVSLSIYNSTFQFTMKRYGVDMSPLVTAVGVVSHLDAFFVVNYPTLKVPYTQKLPFLFIEKANYIVIESECPQWYMHVSEYGIVPGSSENGSQIGTLERFSYECIACTQGRYTAAGSKNTFLFLSQGNISQPHLRRSHGVCLECPYGAVCSGNNVVPRSNYWGYWKDGALIFLRCPTHYCWSGTSEILHIRFNSCDGHRAGVLCGGCEDSFSLSILSNKCISNTKCGNQLSFWLLSVFASFAYTLWYSFKDDILSFPLKCVKNCKYPTKIGQETKQPNQSNKTATVDAGLKKESSPPNFHVGKEGNKFWEDFSTTNVSKGYFGIVAYFIQMSAAMSVHIEFHENEQKGTFLEFISRIVEHFVGIDLSTMDMCPFIDLTTAQKYGHRLLFLLSLYISWYVLYIMVILAMLKSKTRNGKCNHLISSLKLKLLQGMVDITKYTYTAFCSLVFTSVVCVPLGKNSVWWYDGKNVCLQSWQIGMIAFAIIHIIPFPFALFFGMKFLKRGKISALVFMMGCICPLLLVIYCILHAKLFSIKTDKETPISETSEAIICVLQGPYREDPNYHTLYWEAVISTRRLMITATLIANSFMQMIIMSLLCATFLCHHIYFQPFEVPISNQVEAFSLLLLCFIASVNLLKASLADFGVIPSGPFVQSLKGLQSIEKSAILILITFICVIEIKMRIFKGKTFMTIRK